MLKKEFFGSSQITLYPFFLGNVLTAKILSSLFAFFDKIFFIRLFIFLEVEGLINFFLSNFL